MEGDVDGSEGLEGTLGPSDSHGWRSRSYRLRFETSGELESYVQSQLSDMPASLNETCSDQLRGSGSHEVVKTVSWRDMPEKTALVTGWVFPSEERYLLAEEVVGPDSSYYCFRVEMSDAIGRFNHEFARRKRLIEVKYDAA